MVGWVADVGTSIQTKYCNHSKLVNQKGLPLSGLFVPSKSHLPNKLKVSSAIPSFLYSLSV
jgi:hypothetical protein